MEKKTIGGFIAALRKANGLTQKQLAEKLCVSDKAVSRWERDECAPDLTLIPVIAEIFGITTDELLRGQKNNPDTPAPVCREAKTQLQLKNLFKKTHTKYLTQCILCFGLALLGLLVALVCNFGFLRGPLGFVIGCVFTAAAAVLLMVFTIRAFASVEDADVEEEILLEFRRKLLGTCCRWAVSLLILFAFSLPLTMVYDTYMGILFESWLLYGLLFAAVLGCLGAVVSWIVQHKLSKKGILTQPEKEQKLLSLRLRFTGFTGLILAVLLLTQILANSFLPEIIMTGSTFETWEDFKAFMETPMGNSWGDGNDLFITEPLDGEAEDFRYNHQSVGDGKGNVFCTYVERNMSVRRIHYNFSHSEDGLPVTVYTDQDYIHANTVMDDLVNPLFFLSYAAVVIGAAVLYFRKSKKIR